MSDSLDGLDDVEVRDRVQRGEVNQVPEATSRTVAQIVWSNVLTPFNALLGTLFVVILVVGAPADALFGVVLIANAAIGISQEIRAKRTLDRLAVLTTPRARVVRAGEVQEIPLEGVVLDDLLDLQPGDQVTVDGTVLVSDGLEIDESLISGESESLEKQPGDEVLSGSFVAAGTGRFRATRVGRAAYAATLAEQAKQFTRVRSELRDGINRLLRFVTWAIVPTATALFVSQLHLNDSVRISVSGAVAGTVGMVPEGLVLLTSVAFAVAMVRLARSRVLVQELPAVEGLARVDVLCTDKTGTLTEGRLALLDVEALDPRLTKEELAEALAELAGSDPAPNATMRAIRDAYPSPADRMQVSARVAFSSSRRWSGATFLARGTWILGAPEVLLGRGSSTSGEAAIAERVRANAERGRRVVLLARSSRSIDGDTVPTDLDPAALVLLEDRVRNDAPATLAYFERQSVEVKVISGDDPTTVAAVAAEAGLRTSGRGIDGRSLPADPEALAEEVEANNVFGRVTPQQKRSMIAALRSRGHVIAMTGDGVNDVLALKDADIGVAMGSGAAASRAAAELVLLDSSFSSLPAAVAEGRRVIANIERTGNLFLTKTVYAMLLAMAVGVADLPFPFLPRHLTLISALTIGIPGFFLALAPSDRPARSGFIGRILRFAVPAGFLAAAGTFAAYALARGAFGTPQVVAQTTATVVLFAIGLVVLAAIASPLTALRAWLVAGMGAVFVAVLVIPALRAIFALSLPPMIVWLVAGVIAAVVAPVVWLLLRLSQRAQAPLDRAALLATLGISATRADAARGAIGRLGGSVCRRFPRQVDWARHRLDHADPRGLPLTLALGTAAIAAWLFAGLTQDVLGHDDTVLFDPRFTSLVVADRVVWLTHLMQVLTWLGSSVVIVPGAILVGVSLFVRKRDRRPLVLLLAASVGAAVLYDIAKAVIHRPRPPSAIWIGHFAGSSFPSGHATLAVAFFTMLTLALSVGAPPRRKALAWLSATLVCFIVGASRVYLGAHWLTDVLGGYTLGATWVALLTAIGLVVTTRRPRRREAGKRTIRPIDDPSSRREAA